MDNLQRVGNAKFKLAEAFNFDNPKIKNLPYDKILVAAAKFGGPIAITSDPNELIPLNNNTEIIVQNVVILYSNGEICKEFPKKELDKGIYKEKSPSIVGLGFLPDETLFIISKKGIYNIIDPHSGDNNVFQLRQSFMDGEYISYAKTCEESVVFCTLRNQFYKFYLIKKISDPIIQELSINNNPLDSKFNL